MKIIFNKDNIINVETISVPKTNLAKEMISFMSSCPEADYIDVASWFGFDSEMEVIEYLQKNVIEFSSLCPHDVNIVLGNGEKIIVPQAGFTARCESRTEEVGNIAGIPLQSVRYGDVEGLPPFVEGICYIVSRPVYEAAKASSRGVTDLYVVGETIRDGSTILGCKGLTQP